VNDRHEQGGADDRPQDPEWMTVDVDHQWLAQLELGRNPGPEERADEAEGDGSEKAAAHAAGDGPANGAADGRDQDEHDETRQGDRHVQPRSASVMPRRSLLNLLACCARPAFG